MGESVKDYLTNEQISQIPDWLIKVNMATDAQDLMGLTGISLLMARRILKIRPVLGYFSEAIFFAKNPVFDAAELDQLRSVKIASVHDEVFDG